MSKIRTKVYAALNHLCKAKASHFLFIYISQTAAIQSHCSQVYFELSMQGLRVISTAVLVYLTFNIKLSSHSAFYVDKMIKLDFFSVNIIYFENV